MYVCLFENLGVVGINSFFLHLIVLLSFFHYRIPYYTL